MPSKPVADMQETGIPSTLYHYCPISALIGIIDTRQIWASDYKFMNDSQDFRYGVNLFKTVIQQSLDASLGRLTSEVSRILDSKDSCAYVASFSARRDDNGQWKNYARQNGVALGFNRVRLSAVVSDAFFDFGRVEYDRQQQSDIVEAAVFRSLSIFKGLNLSDDDITRLGRSRIGPLVARLSFCKDAAFSSENEWRASAFTMGGATRELYRASTLGLVPYVGLQLLDPKSEDWENIFDEIVVGPGQFQSENASTLKRYCRSRKISCPITTSSSTMRF